MKSLVKGVNWVESRNVWIARKRTGTGRNSKEIVLYRGEDQSEAEEAMNRYNDTKTDRHAKHRTTMQRFQKIHDFYHSAGKSPAYYFEWGIR